jgi:hypothetical protein
MHGLHRLIIGAAERFGSSCRVNSHPDFAASAASQAKAANLRGERPA